MRVSILIWAGNTLVYWAGLNTAMARFSAVLLGLLIGLNTTMTEMLDEPDYD